MIFQKKKSSHVSNFGSPDTSKLHSLWDFGVKFPTKVPSQALVKQAKPKKKDKAPARQMQHIQLLPYELHKHEFGIILPDVGEESLEVLLDWYEKNYARPIPNKLQIRRLHELTSLTKSEIRAWTAKVRKYKLVVVRTDDGTRFLAINPSLKPRKYIKSRKYCKVKKSDEDTTNSSSTPKQADQAVSSVDKPETEVKSEEPKVNT
ncbi:unnamed protein product [Moneuplotes crassus]|uniref:Uncharacterized protein n=1 Tax=Euplotes crassus TaxID=5936 RepID=A0AAD1XJ56_EUPCR|nr:unnamed protein product [Moneuplotes crassus]